MALCPWGLGAFDKRWSHVSLRSEQFCRCILVGVALEAPNKDYPYRQGLPVLFRRRIERRVGLAKYHMAGWQEDLTSVFSGAGWLMMS